MASFLQAYMNAAQGVVRNTTNTLAQRHRIKAEIDAEAGLYKKQQENKMAQDAEQQQYDTNEKRTSPFREAIVNAMQPQTTTDITQNASGVYKNTNTVKPVGLENYQNAQNIAAQYGQKNPYESPSDFQKATASLIPKITGGYVNEAGNYLTETGQDTGVKAKEKYQKTNMSQPFIGSDGKTYAINYDTGEKQILDEGRIEIPGAPQKSGGRAATPVKDSQGRNVYLWPDGKYHTAPPR